MEVGKMKKKQKDLLTASTITKEQKRKESIAVAENAVRCVSKMLADVISNHITGVLDKKTTMQAHVVCRELCELIDTIRSNNEKIH